MSKDEIKRHPIRTQAAWVVVVSALATILGQWGVDAELVNRLVATIAQVTVILAALGFMVPLSEAKVTPMADPRMDDGHPMVPDPLPEHGSEDDYDESEDAIYRDETERVDGAAGNR